MCNIICTYKIKTKLCKLGNFKQCLKFRFSSKLKLVKRRNKKTGKANDEKGKKKENDDLSLLPYTFNLRNVQTWNGLMQTVGLVSSRQTS